jgi:hypothetical protein
MPTLTGEEVTIRREEKMVLQFYQKGNYELKILHESDPLVCVQGACFLQHQKVDLAHPQHQKETISCTSFLCTGLALDGKYL